MRPWQAVSVDPAQSRFPPRRLKIVGVCDSLPKRRRCKNPPGKKSRFFVAKLELGWHGFFIGPDLRVCENLDAVAAQVVHGPLPRCRTGRAGSGALFFKYW